MILRIYYYAFTFVILITSYSRLQAKGNYYNLIQSSDSIKPYEGPDLDNWYRTPKITNWNTDDYKSYIFDSLAIRLLYPKSFQKDSLSDTKFPMIIYFHGFGDRGNVDDNETQLKLEGKYFKDLVDSNLYNGFVLFPQNSDGYWTDRDLYRIHKLIEYLVCFKKVDPLRILLKGYSAGGGGVWRFMKRYPLDIASSIILSHPGGEGDYNLKDIREIPIWLCQGLKDRFTTPELAHWFINNLKSMDIPIHYSEYPLAGHDLSKESEKDPFFLKFLHDSNKLNPKPVYRKTYLGRLKFPTLYVSEGYEQYQWSWNGEIIQGENLFYLNVKKSGVYKVRFKINGSWTGWTPKTLFIDEMGNLVE